MEIKTHILRSSAVTLLSTLATTGFVAFARRNAEISPAFQPLQYSSVAVATAISAYLGYAVFQLLKQYINRPYEFFMYISGSILVLSFMPVGHTAINMEGAGMAEINVLGAIHVIAAVIIISGIAKLEMMEQRRSD